MKYDIILAGVGGQGVLSIAAIIGIAAVERGLYLKQAEVHGLSQRGGEVQSHLRLSDQPIYSDLIPEGTADMVLSMEPMEALRYVSFLSPTGVIVTERQAFINIPNYPDIDRIIDALDNMAARTVLVDSEPITQELRAPRASNMVLLGAASAFLPLALPELEAAINIIFARKGEQVVSRNIEALRRGCAFTEAQAG
ncbi:MAG: indolepyruvate oxidoreductase subunit beta [Anaerolineae bacterium]|nr:indolepyruvate oxidoreductase subunit beta [Anaerolineae bacterium]